MPQNGELRIVYRPKSEHEARRRVARAYELVGNSFQHIPGNPNPKSVAFVADDGTKIRVEVLEMIFNDAVLCDYVSDYGNEGPLYKDTLDTELHKQAFAAALKAYGVDEIPRIGPDGRPVRG